MLQPLTNGKSNMKFLDFNDSKIRFISSAKSYKLFSASMLSQLMSIEYVQITQHAEYQL